MPETETAATASTSPAVPVPKARPFRFHWHIYFTHVPISLYGVSAAFQILHLFYLPDCFEAATNVCLLGAVLAMVPSTFTGWAAWREKYRGFDSLVFRRKIRIAFVMLALSVPLVIWRTFYLNIFESAVWGAWHWIYFGSTLLLIGGATLEGYYGGSLNHR